MENLKINLGASLRLVQPEGRDFWMFTDPTHEPYYRRNNGEKYSSDLVLERCRNGGTFIDAGAHHGYFTLLVATQCKACSVIALEPAPANFEILRMNLRLNNALNVTALNAAVSDQVESRDFRLRDFSSHGSLYDDHFSTVVGTVKVKAVSVDSLLETNARKPIVIKIDTEGHEQHVLKGMTKLLKTTDAVTVLLEFNPVVLGKMRQDPAELLFHIASVGFDIYCVDDERLKVSLVKEDRFRQWEEFLKEGNFQRGYVNLLCTTKAQRLSA